jgi:flagellar motor switch protein FliN/FliY
MTLAPARPAPTDAALVATAAAAAAALVPAAVPLTAVPAAGVLPPPDAVAHVVTHVGAATVEIGLVAQEAVADALEGALTPADVLRPALEAAADAFGPGALDAVRTTAAADVIGDDTQVFALAGPDGVAIAWFCLRVHRPVEPQAPARPGGEHAGLRALYGVDMTLTAEIGRARLPVRQVLDLLPASLLELDRTAGAPADVMVNGRLIARGEVVVIDESYAVRITEIAAGNELS